MQSPCPLGEQDPDLTACAFGPSFLPANRHRLPVPLSLALSSPLRLRARLRCAYARIGHVRLRTRNRDPYAKRTRQSGGKDQRCGQRDVASSTTPLTRIPAHLSKQCMANWGRRSAANRFAAFPPSPLHESATASAALAQVSIRWHRCDHPQRVRGSPSSPWVPFWTNLLWISIAGKAPLAMGAASSLAPCKAGAHPRRWAMLRILGNGRERGVGGGFNRIFPSFHSHGGAGVTLRCGW
jgi:hypothetical protein